MALINRIVRLFRADVNAVLDKLEEPDVLLRQATREMEEYLFEDNQQLKIMISELRVQNKHINEFKEKLKTSESELDICFDSENFVLARNQVRKKLELQQVIDSLDKNIIQLKENKSELENKIEENKTRYLSMKQKLDLYKNTIGEQQNHPVEVENTITEHEVEVAFLHEKKMRSTS